MTSAAASTEVTGRLARLGETDAYRIDHLEQMEPFLTTVVSDTDLWMFVSSTGALTAGRVDADHAIFPYVTDDRLHRSVGTAGPVTVIARTTDDGRELWRPFAAECQALLAGDHQGDPRQRARARGAARRVGAHLPGDVGAVGRVRMGADHEIVVTTTPHASWRCSTVCST